MTKQITIKYPTLDVLSTTQLTNNKIHAILLKNPKWHNHGKVHNGLKRACLEKTSLIFFEHAQIQGLCMCIRKIENIIQDVVSTRSTHFVSKT